MAGQQKNNTKPAAKGKKMAPKAKKADEREETFQAVVCNIYLLSIYQILTCARF